MDASQIFIALSIIVLAIIALLVFLIRGRREANQLTPLTGLAFGCILAGGLFGEERWVGYSLFGIGIGLAVLDIFNKLRSK